ncbi:hypothetical protein R3P38DRAFT_3084126, partial [Favolaschia claudopus]
MRIAVFWFLAFVFAARTNDCIFWQRFMILKPTVRLQKESSIHCFMELQVLFVAARSSRPNPISPKSHQNPTTATQQASHALETSRNTTS